MFDELTAVITRHSTGLWTHTAVPRLSLISADETGDGTDLLYEPMICFATEGAKRTTAGERTWLTGKGHMFLNSLEVPVTAGLERVPYRSAVLSLDPAVLAGLLLELDDPGPQPLPIPGGQVLAPITPDLADALARWVRLLDRPADIRMLAARTEAEILYRLLSGPLGPMLRQFALADSALSRIRDAAAWIRAHVDRPLRIEAIAGIAHMSVATLHRQFKAATGMSPIRYQKHLRLQDARRRLLAGERNVARVAAAVGYTSPSQFNREYRRAYGLPPGQDAARLRRHLTTA